MVVPMISRTVQSLASCRSDRGVTVFGICVDATGVVAPTIVRQSVAVLERALRVDLWLIILFFIQMPRAEVTDPR